MSQIEVPDWVARIANEAGDEFAKTHTMSMYASVSDMRLDRVRHMLTAALGAWVKEVGYATIGNTTGGTLRIDKTGAGRGVEEDNTYWAQHGFHTERVYTLRQEKPE